MESLLVDIGFSYWIDLSSELEIPLIFTFVLEIMFKGGQMLDQMSGKTCTLVYDRRKILCRTYVGHNVWDIVNQKKKQFASKMINT